MHGPINIRLDSKQLGVLIQSNTTIFASSITEGLKQRHVSALYVGHLQVVTGLSDQLYRNAWRVLGGFCGRERY